jgi:tRNA (guanine37-N1)-methyltransferase
MEFAVLTIFPELFDSFWEHGMVRRAIQDRLITGRAIDLRNYAEGRHKVTDDRPYGGGAGMVMKPEPLARAIRAASKRMSAPRVILLSPQGRVFDQKAASKLALCGQNLILVCGRYEGIDERVVTDLVDYEISIGDFILTGGEVAAMLVMDAVTRLIPGVLGNQDSAQMDSFCEDRLEHAHYTRPENFEGQHVPEILLSGDHGKIEAWRKQSSLMHTLLKRPDLLRGRKLSQWEARTLKKWYREIEDIVQTQSILGLGAPSGGG